MLFASDCLTSLPYSTSRIYMRRSCSVVAQVWELSWQWWIVSVRCQFFHPSYSSTITLTDGGRIEHQLFSYLNNSVTLCRALTDCIMTWTRGTVRSSTNYRRKLSNPSDLDVLMNQIGVPRILKFIIIFTCFRNKNFGAYHIRASTGVAPHPNAYVTIQYHIQ